MLQLMFYLQESKKVKSIQMFRKPVTSVVQGDRAGICVTQFDPKLLERGLVCTPGALPTIYAAIARVSKIPYYSSNVETKAKFHISIGHSTTMARLTFFKDLSSPVEEIKSWVLPKMFDEHFDFSKEYQFSDQLDEADK